jgi:SAM-dependent methyltransferase
MSHPTLFVAGLLSVLVLTGRPQAGPSVAPQHERDPGRQEVTLRQVTWDEARAIVVRFEPALPPDLRALAHADRAAAWPSWGASSRAAVAARVAQGDEDVVVNLLLFGTGFTREPRVTPVFVRALAREWQGGEPQDVERTLLRVYQRRAADLAQALARPGNDERLQVARAVLERQGLGVTTPAERERAAAALLAAVARVRDEAARIAEALDAASETPDRELALAARSRVFRERGLSPDSSVLTQYAVDRAIDALRRGEVLEAGSVRRVAIVGPGLDFVDKQEGYDFYPPQSLQPFAVIDSLSRAGLADAEAVRVTTIDVSARVNDHLRRAVDRAQRERAPYRLVFPFDTAAAWRDEAVAYWKEMGAAVGSPFETAVPQNLPDLRARGVAVAPRFLQHMRVLDGNVVYERLDLPEAERFDLVVATNVLLYYDAFEQSLALANIAALLRPGGVLLSNTALLEVPEIPMTSVGYVNVPYSDREGDGERVVIYRRR